MINKRYTLILKSRHHEKQKIQQKVREQEIKHHFRLKKKK